MLRFLRILLLNNPQLRRYVNIYTTKLPAEVTCVSPALSGALEPLSERTACVELLLGFYFMFPRLAFFGMCQEVAMVNKPHRLHQSDILEARACPG